MELSGPRPSSHRIRSDSQALVDLGSDQIRDLESLLSRKNSHLDWASRGDLDVDPFFDFPAEVSEIQKFGSHQCSPGIIGEPRFG